MNEPNTREVVPPSVGPDEPVPEKPFSSSSIHRIAGAIASAVLITVRMFSSERADQAGEDLADVEPQQRHLPQRAHRLRGQRLAGAGHADQQDALGQRQAEVARARAERVRGA